MASLRKRTAELLEAHRGAGGWGHVVDAFLIILILANVVVIILSTLPDLDSQYRQAFTSFELFSVVVFTIEYLLRLWSCVDGSDGQKQNRLHWVFSPLGLIDLIAILPFYIFLFIPDSEMSLLMLRLFRGVRLLRIFKLARYSSALDILFSVMKKEGRVLAVTTSILFTVLILASWGIYALERNAQPEHFSSIPAAMWWAVVTLTTVGYGDVVPLTYGGKIFAGLIALIGIGMMALPAGILASGFSREVHRRTRTFTRAVEMAFADGKLSQHEALGLEVLREELGLSEDEALDAELDAQREELKHKTCPHCGKDL